MNKNVSPQTEMHRVDRHSYYPPFWSPYSTRDREYRSLFPGLCHSQTDLNFAFLLFSARALRKKERSRKRRLSDQREQSRAESKSFSFLVESVLFFFLHFFSKTNQPWWWLRTNPSSLRVQIWTLKRKCSLTKLHNLEISERPWSENLFLSLSLSLWLHVPKANFCVCFLIW